MKTKERQENYDSRPFFLNKLFLSIIKNHSGYNLIERTEIVILQTFPEFSLQLLREKNSK